MTNAASTQASTKTNGSAGSSAATESTATAQQNGEKVEEVVFSSSEATQELPKNNHLYLFQFKIEEDVKTALLLAPTMAEANKIASKELEDKFPDIDNASKSVHSATMIADATVAAIAREVLRGRVRLGWFDEESGASWSIV